MNKLFTAKKLHTDKRGIVFLTVLIVFLILSFIGLSLADLSIAQHSRTTRNVAVSNSLLTAEAGIEQSLHSLNDDVNFAGFAETEFFNNQTQGRGTYQSTISNGSGGNEKIIISTGRVYRYNETTDPLSERKVKVTIVGTTAADYSVYTGPGGLILSGNAAITNSDVAVNGTITMSGNATIGTAAQPRNIDVAHIACPTGSNPGPTYPTLCTSGQPITITGTSAKIYGTVCATNQTTSTNILPGSGGQGLVAGCEADEVTIPTYDRDAHLADIGTVGSASNNAYTCSGNDTKTWPANLRLNGNVSLSGNCKLTITGNVYITGSFSAGSNTQITIAAGVGETRPVIMTDDVITLGGNTTIIPNADGTSAHLVSFKSTALCSPNCATVTGTDLKNSQALTTVSVSGNGSLPGAIFQAHWSKVVMASNGVTGAAIGQTIDISGNGTIVFGETLASGESTWTIRSYQQVFD